MNITVAWLEAEPDKSNEGSGSWIYQVHKNCKEAFISQAIQKSESKNGMKTTVAWLEAKPDKSH